MIKTYSFVKEDFFTFLRQRTSLNLQTTINVIIMKNNVTILNHVLWNLNVTDFMKIYWGSTEEDFFEMNREILDPFVCLHHDVMF